MEKLMSKLNYDIRTIKHAQQTLSNLTGIPISVWEKHRSEESQFDYPDDFVEDMIKRYGKILSSYKDFEFIYFHVTTSANDCASIRKHGILDLKQSYLCEDSELKMFLDSQGIFIDLDNNLLMYRKKEFDITYVPGKTNITLTSEIDKCRDIG